MNAPLRPRRHNAGKSIAPRHKSVARMIGYCLFLGENEDWRKLPDVLRCRLNPYERIALATMALEALDEANAAMVAGRYSEPARAAGFPVAPLDDGLAEAQLWATAATPAELRAYVLTGFNALPHKDRLDFLDHVNGRAAA